MNTNSDTWNKEINRLKHIKYIVNEPYIKPKKNITVEQYVPSNKATRTRIPVNKNSLDGRTIAYELAKELNAQVDYFNEFGVPYFCIDTESKHPDILRAQQFLISRGYSLPSSSVNGITISKDWHKYVGARK